MIRGFTIYKLVQDFSIRSMMVERQSCWVRCAWPPRNWCFAHGNCGSHPKQSTLFQVGKTSGWWFGTWILCFQKKLGTIIQIDELIFFRGVGLNHQPDLILARPNSTGPDVAQNFTAIQISAVNLPSGTRLHNYGTSQFSSWVNQLFLWPWLQ